MLTANLFLVLAALSLFAGKFIQQKLKISSAVGTLAMFWIPPMCVTIAEPSPVVFVTGAVGGLVMAATSLLLSRQSSLQSASAQTSV